MRRIRVDFATRSAVPARAAQAFAIACLAVTAFELYVGFVERTKELDLEAQVTALRERAAAVSQPASAPSPAQPPYARDAAEVLRAASYDFGAVLTALEHVRVPNVRVTSIDIATAEHSTRVELEFTEGGAMLGYVDELNAGIPPDAARWKLVRIQMPSGTSLGVATVVAPADIGDVASSLGQARRRP